MSLSSKMERLNSLRGAISIFDDNPNRLNNKIYLGLLDEANRVAKELREMKEYQKLERLRD